MATHQRRRIRVKFIYLGRRGALGRFVVELVEAAMRFEELEPSFLISRANELAPVLLTAGPMVSAVDTFEAGGAGLGLRSFVTARRKLLADLDAERTDVAITLMPHVWTPLLAPAIRGRGIPYVTVIHDCDMHPGDRTGLLNRWLLTEAKRADLVVTLGRTVATRLMATTRVAAHRILALFHPDLDYGRLPAIRRRDGRAPLKLLFFGRILKYKGLPLLVDAVEMLRSEGIAVQLGVVGSGDLRDLRPRLEALGAEVVNRWLADTEVGPLLARYDAVALSHIEASQSGVAATAFGSRMPAVATPVAGLAEQVLDGRTGVLARRVSARSLADAIHALAVHPGLYDAITDYLAATADERSMARFLDELVAEALALAPRR